MVMIPSFWKGKKIFLTGHTGFKGSWLSIWLLEMGAEITGYSADIPTHPSLFKEAGLDEYISHITGDVRDYDFLRKSVNEADPDILFHMAAQPLVRLSYEAPRETFETNVMGTVNVLDILRQIPGIKSAVIVTTDKCYENRELDYGYRETDPMGGFDPYSGSKGAAELVVAAYNQSYFKRTGQVISSARAGNVIGGGDWAKDRLVPDVIRAIQNEEKVLIRNPKAVRPWQHVLEPLSGYLILAEEGYSGKPLDGGWNFGPAYGDAQNVQWVTEKIGDVWGKNNIWETDGNEQPHEAGYLKLDISKAFKQLKWKPKWNAETAVEKTINWYKDFFSEKIESKADVYQRCVTDLKAFLNEK